MAAEQTREEVVKTTPYVVALQHDRDAPELILPVIWVSEKWQEGVQEKSRDLGYTVEVDGKPWPHQGELMNLFTQGVWRIDSRIGGWVELRDTTEGAKRPVRFAHPRPRARETGAEWVMGLQPR